MTMPDLIVESVLRDGFKVLKRNPQIIDKIFHSLTRNYVQEKYGQKELERIKEFIKTKDWSFVSSFAMVEANLPCVSIQLGAESEAKEVAHLEDFDGEAVEPIYDPDELADLVVVPSFTPTGFDPQSGAVSVQDNVNLTQVYPNLVFVDASGNEFFVTGGIDLTPGQQQFMITLGSAPNIAGPCIIKSSIDYIKFSNKSVHTDVQLLLGIHTKDALLTKYMYLLVKYFLIARKKSLIERNFICSSFSGSDFTRDLKYQADIVYTRFLTLTGKVQDQFSSELDQIFDSINVIVQVAKDVATNEELGRQNLTVQVNDNDYQGSDETSD